MEDEDEQYRLTPPIWSITNKGPVKAPAKAKGRSKRVIAESGPMDKFISKTEEKN